jgi:uncharacterized membrane protein
MPRSLTGRERYRPNKQDMGWSEERADQNVGQHEAFLSGVAGAILFGIGVTRRSIGGTALALAGATLLHRGITRHCMVYEVLGSSTSTLGRRKVATGRAFKTEKRIRIDREPAELYQYWRKLSNLPRIMPHLESVDEINDRLSHWVVKTIPGAPSVEWDAEIVNEVENTLIGWRSLADSDVDTAGSVRFRPTRDGRGTELSVTLQYDLPGGHIGEAIAKLIGKDPERLIEEDLERFKEAMESRERIRR